MEMTIKDEWGLKHWVNISDSEIRIARLGVVGGHMRVVVIPVTDELALNIAMRKVRTVMALDDEIFSRMSEYTSKIS